MGPFAASAHDRFWHKADIEELKSRSAAVFWCTVGVLSFGGGSAGGLQRRPRL